MRRPESFGISGCGESKFETPPRTKLAPIALIAVPRAVPKTPPATPIAPAKGTAAVEPAANVPKTLVVGLLQMPHQRGEELSTKAHGILADERSETFFCLLAARNLQLHQRPLTEAALHHGFGHLPAYVRRPSVCLGWVLA